MKNIMESVDEVKESLSDDPVPLSLDWSTRPGPLPWETSVVDGLGNIVATCPRHDLALYIQEGANHFGECRDGLASAREVLLLVLQGKASIQKVVDAVTELEHLISESGGSY